MLCEFPSELEFERVCFEFVLYIPTAFTLYKICLASVHLIQPGTVWDKYGNNANCMHMYFNAKHSVRFNGKYALYVGLASSVSFVLVLVPTLFILFYQNVFFQRCLQYFTKCKFCKFRMLMN